jgi:hypothetical protein
VPGSGSAVTRGADAVVEIRSGALSTNRNEMFVGIPSIDLPISLVENTSTPELGILKKNERTGLAKIGMTIHETKTGAAGAILVSRAGLRLCRPDALGRAFAHRLDQHGRHA